MHIDEPLLYIVLLTLTLATALNLFLTLRVAAIVRPEPPLLTLPIGQAAAPFAGRSADGRLISSDDLSGQPAVLVFLSSACPACRETAAELIGLLPAMRDAGVGLWIVPADATYDISALLDGTPLADHLVVLDAADARAAEPANGGAALHLPRRQADRPGEQLCRG